MQDNSLRDRIQGNWKQLSGSVRHEWGKLTHNDVEQVKGDVEVLVGKIQDRYGVTKAEARKPDRPVGGEKGKKAIIVGQWPTALPRLSASLSGLLTASQ